MKEFEKIIEQLRKEGYFLFDVMYTAWDNENISADDNLQIEHKNRNPRNLARVLLEHIENGIMIRPTRLEVHFKSYKMKVPEQHDEKIDNRCDYYVDVDFEKRTAEPPERMVKSPNLPKIYEDFERVFRSNGWSFNTGI